MNMTSSIEMHYLWYNTNWNIYLEIQEDHVFNLFAFSNKPFHINVENPSQNISINTVAKLETSRYCFQFASFKLINLSKDDKLIMVQ